MRSRSPWLYLFCLWLSLGTVFAHAVLPAGSPVSKGRGSAFSFSTTDVALSPVRRKAPGKDVSRAISSDSADSEDWTAADPPLLRPKLVDQVAPILERAATGAGSHEPRAGAPSALGFRSRAPPIVDDLDPHRA